MTVHATHGQRLSGLLLISGSIVGLIGNALHPHAASLDRAGAIQALAVNDSWAWIHLAIITAILFIIGGLVGLSRALVGPSSEPLARLGLAAALLGGAVVTVSTAMDGFGMKALADSAAGAATADPAELLRIAVAVDMLGFGIWTIGMLVFFGVAFVCFGAAVVVSRRFPAWYGWVAIVGGTGSAIAALIQIAAGGEEQVAESMFLASSVLLTGWVFLIGLRMWRSEPGAVTGTGESVARVTAGGEA